MIGTLAGCLSTPTGSSTETPAVVKTEPSGVYVDAPYPEDGKESFGIALLDFEGTPGKVQCYWFSKSKGKDLFFNSRFMAPVDYEICGNKIIFKDVVLSKYPEQGAKDYTGTYDGATDTVGMPNEFIAREGTTYTFVKPTTEDYFTLIPPVSDKNYMTSPFLNGDGVTSRWFMKHDAVNKTMQFYFIGKEQEAPRDYTGTYNGATDTIDIPNEFPGRSPGGFTTVSFTTEDYFKLKPAFIPLSDTNYMRGPFENGDGVICCWFMEHDAVNKTMQLYFVGKEQSGLKTYPKFGKMENGTWVASPASYEDTGKGTLRFKNVWVFENDAPVDFEITYGKYEGITLPNINAGFGGDELFLEPPIKTTLIQMFLGNNIPG